MVSRFNACIAARLAKFLFAIVLTEYPLIDRIYRRAFD